MRLQRWSAVVFACVAVVGCGGDEGGAGGGGADPAQAIPADAPVYVEAVVRPEGEPGDNARELIERFLGDQTLVELIDEQLADEDPPQTYAEDIEPWLGERIGVGVTDLAADEPGFVGAIAVTDAEAAEAAIAEGSQEAATAGDVQLYETDGSYAGVTGDFIVFADAEADVRAAIGTLDAQSIADDQRFRDAIGELPEERLGALYVDTRSFAELAAQDPSVDPAARGIIEQFLGDGAPVTAALTAEPDSATIEARVSTSGLGAVGPFVSGEAPELVAEAPAGSFAVLGYTDVGATLKGALDTFAGAFGGAALTGQIESQTGINLERDVFSWIGDVSVFVRGDAVQSLDGAAVIEVTDTGAAEAAIPRIIAAARKDGAPVQAADIEGASQAFTLPLPGAPGPLVMAYGSERVVFAVGEQAAADGLAPGETIQDSGLYERAEGAIDGLAPSAIVDIASVIALADASGETDADFEEARPYLEMIDLIVTGAEEDGDSYRSLFTVKAK